MPANGNQNVSMGRIARRGLLGVAVAAPLVVGLVAGAWPGPGWHSGPIVAELDLEARATGFAPAPIVEAAAIEAAARPATISRAVRVARGDTLMALLVRAGAGRAEAHEAIVALRPVYDPRGLKPGQRINVGLAAPRDSAAKGGRLLSISLRPSVERDVRVIRGADAAFIAKEFARKLDRRAVAANGRIESNLSLAARAAGLPRRTMSELIRLYSFDVDFQRDLRKGDRFEVLYEGLYEQDGKLAKSGNILYAALTLSGQRLDLYRFTPKSGRTDYFDAKGRSVRKTLMRTPIDGARLSSGFGMRRHPILGYSRMHRGTDFAAPRGTPIYAAGDGRIEVAGRKGGYGRYVRIRHNSTYKSAYAHMSRIAKGMRKGKRVKQGQVIGYVGSSGRSTGPHLHYEVMVNGKQVNPRKVKLPSGEKLKSADLAAFAARRGEIDRMRAAANGQALMAGAECPGADGALRPASGPADGGC
ncbi:MAG: peptidoglycan DD-metalloendopeptidase family protein [Kiloniellaceae bacterium]